MSSRPYYRWYPSDFYGDTRRLSFIERAIYREILDELWRGPFLATASEIASLCGIDEDVAAGALAAIGDRLQSAEGCPPGWIDHPKMRAQREEVAEKSRKARAAGSKGGRAKASKRLANATENSSERLPTRARAGAQPRARPDPDPDLNQTPKPISEVGTSTAREAGSGMSPEDRAEAERLNRVLEKRRELEGIGSGARPAAVTALAALGRSGGGSEEGKNG